MTVSRVMREQPNVKEKTRERVLKAIKALNYHPTFSARALSKNITGNIGLIVTHKKTYDDIFSYIANGIANACFRHNYSLMTFTHSIDPDHLPPMITQRKVDGVIIGGAGITPQILDKINSIGLPMVIVHNHIESPSVNSVLPEDFEGAYNAVRYLISLGHKNIACVMANSSDYSTQKRLQGYQLALISSGLAIKDDFIIQVNLSADCGHEAGKKVLATPHRPTAVFCTDDILAIGVFNALSEAGIDIPEDISLIGFGNLEASKMTQPNLTTVHFEKELVGVLAVHKLLEYLQYKEIPAAKTLLPTKLVVRNSCTRIYN